MDKNEFVLKTKSKNHIDSKNGKEKPISGKTQRNDYLISNKKSLESEAMKASNMLEKQYKSEDVAKNNLTISQNSPLLSGSSLLDGNLDNTKNHKNSKVYNPIASALEKKLKGRSSFSEVPLDYVSTNQSGPKLYPTPHETNFTQRSTSLTQRHKSGSVQLPPLHSPERKKQIQSQNPTNDSIQRNTDSLPTKNNFKNKSPIIKPMGLRFDNLKAGYHDEASRLQQMESQKITTKKPTVVKKTNQNENQVSSPPISSARRKLVLEKIDTEIKLFQNDNNNAEGNRISPVIQLSPRKKKFTSPVDACAQFSTSGTSFNHSYVKRKQEILQEKEEVDMIERRASFEKRHDNKVLINFRAKTQAGKSEGGYSKTNQDSYLIHGKMLKIESYNMFGVLDGHGNNGHLASNSTTSFLKNYLSNEDTYKLNPSKHMMKLFESDGLSEVSVYESLKENNYELLKTGFMKAEAALSNETFDVNFSGTTCALVIQIGERIICANVGDSRAIMVSETKQKRSSFSITKTRDSITSYAVEALSIDHKPDLEGEKLRIENSGGRIEQYSANGVKTGPLRVWVKNESYPGLAMSRSIGDLIGTSVGVTSCPEITEHDITGSSRYIIIASDGVWEFLDNMRVMFIVNPYYEKNDPEGACDAIIAEATQWWEKEDTVIDDITVIAIFFVNNNNNKP